MYDVDSGVCTPYSAGTLYLYDNAIEKVRANGHHVVFDTPAMASKTTGTGNLFAPNYRFSVGGVETIYGAKPRGAVGSNSVVTSIGFTNPAGGDFKLLATSPAIGFGTTNKIGIWDYYLSRYGVRLSVDRNGIRRDTSATLESGASER